MKKADFYSFLKDAEQIAYGSNRKRTFLFKGIISLLIIEMFFIGAFPMTVIAGNLPEMSGGYKQGMTVNGQTLTIDASAGNRFVWDHGFNIGADYSVRFEGIKTAINKDTSGNLSSILGSLYSDGAVYLLNPNGILFGAGSKVNVRGLVAAAVGDVEESPDGLIFSKLGTGTVINEGNISAGDFAYLVGSSVKNSGAIQASEIALAAYGNKGADSVIIASHENGAVITFNLSDSNDSSLLTEGTVENTGSLGKDSNDDSNLGLLDVTIPDSEVDDTSYEYNGTVSAAGDNIIIGNTVKAGTITVVADGNLTVDAGLDAGNNGSITLTAGKSFDNTITGTIDGGDIVISAADGNVSINGTLNAKQDLSIEAVNGNINQTAAITVGNEASIKASEDITLNSLDNNFAGAVNIEGTNIKLVDASAIELGAVTATGNLDVNAQGAITQSGAADVEGTTKLVAKSDTEKFDITLNNGANNFNDIAAEGANITLVDANTIKLSEVTASTLTLGADSEVSGTVSATDIAAGTTTVKVNTGADVNVGETLTAGKLDVDGGAVDAKNITATTVDQDGGAITVTETIKGDVEVDGATSTLKAAKVDGKLTQDNGTVGEAGKALEVTGALTQNGGTIDAGDLTLGSTATTKGTVNATTIANTGLLTQEAGAINAGEITGAVAQSGGTIKGANGTGDVKIDGALTQTAGAIDASTLTLGADSEVAGTVNANTVGAGTTTLKVSGSADVNVTETLTAGTLDVYGGTVDAKNITATTVDQDGGAITVTETIKGDVEVNGTSTLKATKVDGALTQDNGTVGEAGKALEVTGALTQNGGTINAGDLILGSTATTKGTVNATTIANTELLTQEAGAINAGEIKGAVAQNGGEIKGANGAGDVKIGGALTQNGGTIDADTLTLGADSEVAGTVKVDTVAADGKTLTVKTGADVDVTETLTAGTLDVYGGTVDAKNITATTVDQDGGAITVTETIKGDVEVNGTSTLKATKVDGALTQDNGTVGEAGKALEVTGALTQNGGTINAGDLTLGSTATTKGTVNATTIVNTELLTQEAGAINAGEITGAITQSGGEIKGANGTGDVKIGGALTQTAGAIDASTLTLGADSEVAGTVNANTVGAGTTTLTVKDGADVDVSETLTAGTLDVDGGAVDAKNITATTVDQDGGEITVTETIKGDVEVDGDSKLEAKKVDGTLTQHAGTVGHADKALEVTKALTQNGGTIKATTLTLGADSEVAGIVNVDTVAAGTTTLKVSGSADVNVTETLTAGTLDVDGGAVDAKNITATVYQDGGTITVTETITGDVNVDGTTSKLEAKKVVGTLTQTAGTVGDAGKALEVTKKLTQTGGAINATTLTLGADSEVAGTVNANTVGAGAATLTVKDGADVDVTETLTAGTLDVDGGTVDAKNITATVYQDGGTITVTETITGDVNVAGDASKLEAKKVDGTLTQHAGTVGHADKALEVTKALTQNGGTIKADTLTLNGGATQTAGKIVANTLAFNNEAADISLTSKQNDFDTIEGNGKNVKLVDADAIKLGEVKAGGYFVAQALDGNIDVTDTVTAKNTLLDAKGDITVDATVDGENVTLNAGKDVVENAAVNATADKVVVAGNNIKANSSFDANNAVYKSSNEVAFNGAAEVAGVLGVQAENDITVAGTGIKADTLVLRSTAGDIDVEISGNTQNLAVQADQGTVNVEADDITVINGASAVAKRVNADGVASDNESVAANGITGAAGVDVTIDGNLNASSITGGDVALNINGNADVDSISGGDIDLDVAGNAGIKSIDGANIDANIADNAELSSIDGDNVNLVIGSDLTVDEMSAGDVIAEVGGNFAVGQVTAGDVELTVNGDLEDNDSLIEADNLIADVGGDIGTIDAPINVKVQRIDSVKGHNVNITDKTISDVVELGVIQAQGNLNLVAESIGMPNGEGGYVDANGDALNISVGADALLNIAGYMGRASDQLEVKINGNVTIDSSNLFGLPIINVAGQIGTPINYFYMLFEGNAASLNWNRYIGNGKIPGIVIYNGQVYAASPDLWLKINRALAFTIETPELKSKQGVFGAPLFIHTDMDVSEAASIGAVDYISIASTSLDTLADPDVNEALIYIDDDSSKDRIKRRFERNVKNPNGLDKLYSREFTSSVK